MKDGILNRIVLIGSSYDRYYDIRFQFDDRNHNNPAYMVFEQDLPAHEVARRLRSLADKIYKMEIV